MKRLFEKAVIVVVASTMLGGSYLAMAQEAPSAVKDQVDALSGQVKQKEQRIKELESVIRKYKDRIQEQNSAQATLQNELSLLENRVAERELAIERTRTQIELANLEVQRVSSQLTLEEQRYAERRESLAAILSELQDAQSVSLLETFVTNPSLSDFFTRIEELELIQGDLAESVRALKDSKGTLEKKRTELEAYRLSLQDQKGQLEKEQYALEAERAAKSSLLAETSEKEAEFQRIMYELRQEQQIEADAASEIEDRLKEKLNSIDQALARGDILLNWPIFPKRISAYFHDPTYPFKKMFEHPGVDLPTPVGTPVKAAAGGYVAWTKVGKQYGNYLMVIHPGGVATIYAHLRSFNVKADTYVERGDVIGFSGGRPGDQGAGLSTGPHLHFEVRQNGIPVNPEQFLPSRD